ncbi:putative rRNA maturation factor [Pedobacter sp. UYP30]|uniref:rRNA maturation RNase YbeY n=1 Tax=Pedobacter sp. UYP30 TaxID=1756400 RepID=UPI00339715A1
MPSIHFFKEDTTYNLPNKLKVKTWIRNTISAEGFTLDEMNIVFCSDEYLLEINQKYLDHDTFTDIITFDNSEVHKQITSDIFISIERVRENTKLFKTSIYDEVCRIMVHGTLHLLGYGDKSKLEKTKMTEKEDFYLSKRIF